MRTITLLSLLSAAGSLACVDELPAEQQPCPCAPGWTCDTSQGEPGICRQEPAPDSGVPDLAEGDADTSDSAPADAGPPPLCANPVVSFLDRFDDGHLDDWDLVEPSVELVDEQLLALRTATTGRGLARRPLLLGDGALSVELELTLHSDNSRGGFSLGQAGTDLGCTVALSNSPENDKPTGLVLVGGPQLFRTDVEPQLYFREMVPEKGRPYRLRLEWRPGGQLALYLDDLLEAQVTDSSLTRFDRLYLGGGQDSEAGHGAAFDNLVVRSCGLPLPRATPDAQNPLWEGCHSPYALLRAGEELRLYCSDSEGFFLARSPDGQSWTSDPAQLIGPAQTGELFNRHIALLERGGTYQAWVTATSADCIEYSKVFRLRSADGLAWTLDGQVLACGELGSYDSRNLDVGSVLYDGSSYHLYYFALQTDGGDQCDPNSPKREMGIGYASSPDGDSWTRHGIVVPLGPPGAPDSLNARKPVVGRDQGGYWMYYTGASEAGQLAIMYASSPDGLVWTRHGALDLEAKGPIGEIDGQLYYGCGGAICRAAVQR